MSCFVISTMRRVLRLRQRKSCSCESQLLFDGGGDGLIVRVDLFNLRLWRIISVHSRVSLDGGGKGLNVRVEFLDLCLWHMILVQLMV